MMKYLVLVVVVVAVLWFLRLGRRRSAGPPVQPPAQAAPLEMVRCSHCKVHVPRHEALTGPRGMYCCQAHRDAAAASG